MSDNGELENDQWTFDFEKLVDCVTVKERCGYVKDVETALEVLAHYEKATTSKFVTRWYSNTTAKSFGNEDATEKPHSVLWQKTHIPFSGVPFMIIGSKVLICQHGPDDNVNKKLAYAEKTKDNPYIKRRSLKRNTKKLNCQAQVILYDVVVFPDHKIKVDSKKRRNVKSAALRRELTEGTTKQERRVYICLPTLEDHVGHTVEKRILPPELNFGLVSSRTMTSNESSTEAASKLTAAFVTVPDATVAEKLASDIVQQKLAACVNIIPGLTSVYEWEGKIEKDQELLLMIKTKRSKIDELTEFVRKNHPYQLAEVISLPIENGNLPYLQWVAKTVPE